MLGQGRIEKAIFQLQIRDPDSAHRVRAAHDAEAQAILADRPEHDSQKLDSVPNPQVNLSVCEVDDRGFCLQMRALARSLLGAFEKKQECVQETAADSYGRCGPLLPLATAAAREGE